MSSIPVEISITQELAELAQKVANLMATNTNRERAAIMGLLVANICLDAPDFVPVYAQIIEKVAQMQVAAFLSQGATVHHIGAVQ